MATAKPATEPIAVKPAANPATGFLTVNIFDGTREPIPQPLEVLFTIRDGAQNQLFRDFVKSSSVKFELPFHNNFADNYAVVAFANDYEQAGFQPVPIGPHAPGVLDLMLLPKNGTFHFANARWTDVIAQKAVLAQVFAASVSGAPANSYGELMEKQPAKLACLLNITTAMQQISLPQQSPLDYFKVFDLTALASDRIFGFADVRLLDQLQRAAQQGEFDVQPTIDVEFHGDATSSYKQNEFGEANVQITFHGKETRTIDGVDCVYVETDIDYFKDPAAHLLLEVIPNGLTGNVSDPRVVYVLRWIAGRTAGIPEFDPLYTIE
jgi:hypothetical protein